MVRKYNPCVARLGGQPPTTPNPPNCPPRGPAPYNPQPAELPADSTPSPNHPPTANPASEGVWGEFPPPMGRTSPHYMISRLRIDASSAALHIFFI